MIINPAIIALILLYLIRDIVTEFKELVARRSPAATIDEKSEPV